MNWLRNDYRTKESIAAAAAVLDVPEGALALSIGGGPKRASARFLNLNIEKFDDVDVVGDAHALPYEANTVDAVFSEAVFEHLHDPALAAREMFRVMKPGAKAFVSTPFLQGYHAHPNHYQNFTLAGHRLLFERAGFTIIDSGVCVGPIIAITTLIAATSRALLPHPLGLLGASIPILARVMLGPLDHLLTKHRNAHVVCSVTYVVARKD